MPIKSDVEQQLQSYKGILGWVNTGLADVEIELFIKNHPIPARKPKITEIGTITMQEPYAQVETNTQAIFYGAPEPLSVQLEGWIITPTVKSGNGYAYNPRAANGVPLGWGNVSYGEIISLFVMGKLTLNAAGVPQRRDPNYYITPYGQVYRNPIISSWSPQFGVVQAKQQFSIALLLEK